MLSFTIKSAQALLLVGALALIWTAVLPLLARSATPRAPSPRERSADLDTGIPSLPRYRIIADRNLFRTPEKPSDLKPADLPQVEETKLQVALIGTAAVSSADALPEQPAGRRGSVLDGFRAVAGPAVPENVSSVAILRDTNGEIVTLRVGDTLASGSATLVGIEPRRALIEHAGRLEAVSLADEAASSEKDRSRAKRRLTQSRQRARRAARPALPGVQSGIDNAQIRRLMNAQRQLGSFQVGQGSNPGIVVTAVQPGSPLEELGIQAGERISGINGEAAQGAIDILRVLIRDRSKGVVLTVEAADGATREVQVAPGSIDKLTQALR